MTDNIKELASQFADSVKNVQALGDEIKGRMEKGEKNFESLKEQADEALNSMGELKARLTELEQKAARSGGEPEKVKSLGELLVESDGIKELTASTLSGKAARLSTKATISSLTTDAAGSAGALIVPDRLPGIVAMPTRPLMMRDLIGKGTTASDQISYVRETGFTNNAGTVAEGEAFNYSDLKFTEKKVDVQYVGHLAKATRKILNDAPQLASFINQRLIYGLKDVEDRQILNGDGNGTNLHGIMTQASAFADPATLKTYTLIDQLRLAMLQVAIAGYPANGVVLNPIDWAKIELEKDATGRNIIGNPQSGGVPMLWRMPVVETTAVGAGKFLTGAFDLGAQLFDREEVGVEVSTENKDDFEKNLITVKCYERLALAVYRPEAFVKGTLAAKAA
ncbi:MAG: phage major capsid protein [Neisseria sp.]|nr:MAG: phage major capsid protein [Neisseria sp.]